MFLGTYEPKLDDKGRLILPSRFRDQLSAGVVLTPGQERCIYAFPASEFETIYEELRQAPLTHKEARKFSRVMLSGATDQIPDKQGRINIPANLRQYAGLNKNLKVIGAGARAEIWDADTWDTYLSESEDAFAEIAEEIVPGLL